MKQRTQRGKLQGVLEATGSACWLQISSSARWQQHQCPAVVISVNCCLPLAAGYLGGIQFHCIFANKYQMTVRKAAVFSCIYPLISRAEQDPVSIHKGSNKLRHCQNFRLLTACLKAKVIQALPCLHDSPGAAHISS